MRPIHRATAARIESQLHGDVLCVGGLWIGARDEAAGYRITVSDLSLAMLWLSRKPGLRLACADALELPFPGGSFDHVVYPLVLHHLAGRSVSTGRALVRSALREGARVLKKGGRLWISELTLSEPLYALQRFSTPLVRGLLGLVGEPYVAMHTPRFFGEALRRAGLNDAVVERVRPPGVSRWDWVRPVIAAPWLRIPRWLFPLRATLLCAEKGSDASVAAIVSRSAP